MSSEARACGELADDERDVLLICARWYEAGCCPEPVELVEPDQL